MTGTLTRSGKLDEAVKGIAKLCPDFPKIVIVLGSGLASLLKDLAVETEFAFRDVPHMKSAGVEGHVSRVIVGRLGAVRVACMQGRLHYYEGHAMEDVVFPFRAFALAGAEIFLLTNAAGGLQPDMKPLDLMLIRDHVNLMGTNPLIGPNDDRLGPRFPDMTHVYDPEIRRLVAACAARLEIPLRQGVYLAISGPSYETPAEIRMYRALGADAVGMSTVPEAIALRHMGKRVAGISCITNLAAGVTDEPLVHSDVLESAKKIHGRFAALVSEAVAKIDEERRKGK